MPRFRNSKKRDRAHNSAERQAKDANERADGAASNAQSAIDAATEIAKRASKIEHQLGRRRIAPEHRKRMVHSLSRFAGQRFMMAWRPGDNESQITASEFAMVLMNSGWQLDTSTHIEVPPRWQGIISDGIFIFANNEDAIEKTKTVEAVEALAKVFSTGYVEHSAILPRSMIIVMIPPKPPDPDTLNEMSDEIRKPTGFEERIIAACSALNRYQGQRVSVYCPMGDRISERMAFEFFDRLSAAGWKLVSELGATQIYPANFENVHVGISDADNSGRTIPEAATSLLNAMKENRIVGKGSQLRVFQGMPGGEISIRISISPFNLEP